MKEAYKNLNEIKDLLYFSSVRIREPHIFTNLIKKINEIEAELKQVEEWYCDE